MENQIPPPPYSETDLFSNNGSSSHRVLTPTTSNPGDLSTTSHRLSEHDPSSIGDSIIYTPPFTPDGDEHFLTITSSAAAAYFESRPVARPSVGPVLVHAITVNPQTPPEDLPFPQQWSQKDVTEQDWATFVNYLIPSHADTSNSHVADRKLQAETIDQRMGNLTLDHGSQPHDSRYLDAQLNQLRPLNPLSKKLMGDVNRITAEWNDGFFAPRGLQVNVTGSCPRSPEDLAGAMPGAWTIDPEEEFIDDHSFDQGRSRGRGRGGHWVPGEFRGHGHEGRGFGRGGRGGFIRADNTGFHVGGLLSADNEGFRLGGRRGLVADNNGFRIGNFLSADNDGFRIGGLRFGAGAGTTVGSDAQRCPVPGPAQQGRESTSRHHGYHRERRERRRDHSKSSSSSSASTVSSASDESVGSLPDYDHIKKSQLPVVKQSLLDWLNHPDQPITKESVKQLKAELKNKATKDSPNEVDTVTLRQEVKTMMKSFKELKRTQKVQRRASKRERRVTRKNEKRERKALRKQEKKVAKTAAKGKGRAWFTPPTPPTPAMPFSPPIPSMVPTQRGYTTPMMPMMPNMPNMPTIPTMGIPGIPYPTPNHLGQVPTSRSMRLRADARKLQADAYRVRADASNISGQANSYDADDKARLKLQDVASNLEGDAQDLMARADTLLAQAMHLEAGGTEAPDKQQSGVTHY